MSFLSLLCRTLQVSRVSWLLLYFISSTNTSFDTLNFSSASRTTSPSRSSNPAAANGSSRPPSVTPYSLSIRPTSIPSNWRNLRMPVTRGAQCRPRHFVKFRHLIFARHRSRAILPTSGQQRLPQPASFIHFQQIHGHMLRLERNQLRKRLFPTVFGLVRQSCDQIEADIANPRLAQNRHGPINVRAPVHTPC